jgi:hypothetical protein
MIGGAIQRGGRRPMLDIFNIMPYVDAVEAELGGMGYSDDDIYALMCCGDASDGLPYEPAEHPVRIAYASMMRKKTKEEIAEMEAKWREHCESLESSARRNLRARGRRPTVGGVITGGTKTKPNREKEPTNAKR